MGQVWVLMTAEGPGSQGPAHNVALDLVCPRGLGQGLYHPVSLTDGHRSGTCLDLPSMALAGRS